MVEVAGKSDTSTSAGTAGGRQDLRRPMQKRSGDVLRRIARKAWADPAARGGLVFIIASGAVNASNFVFHLVLSRLLGPSAYGAFGALLNVTAVVSVPLGALQVTVAQSVVRRDPADGPPPLGRLVAIAAAGGTVAVAVWLAATPTIDRFFHLDSPRATVVLGLWLLPAAVGAVLEGVLLGQRRFRAVAAGQLIGSAIIRLAAGVVLVDIGTGITGGAAATLAAMVVTLAVYAGALRHLLGRRGRFVPRAADALLSTIAIAGATLLTSIDAWLARHFLAPHPAGLFTAAATAGRIALFLPGTITLIYFPRLAATEGRGAEGRRLLARATGLVTLVAVMAALVLALAPTLSVGVLFGASFDHAAVAVGTVALADAGIAVSICLIYFQVARSSRLALAAWPTCVFAVGLAAAFHGSMEVLALDMLGSSGALLVGIGMPTAVGALRSLADETASLPRQAILLEPATVDLTVVVPCHNVGSERLARHLQRICDTLTAADVSFEVVPVSDGSTDDSPAAFGRLPASFIRPIVWTDNRGKGEALRAGLSAGRGKYLGFIDGDGDIPADGLAGFVELARSQRPDVVVGSKRHPEADVHYPALRRMYSFGYQLLTGALFGLAVRDTQTGVKLVRRDVVAEVLPRMVQKRYAFDLELLAVAHRLGYRQVVELPVTIGERFRSTISPLSVWRMLQDTLATFYRLRVLRFYDPPLVDPGAPPVAADGADLVTRLRAGECLRILVCNWRDLAHPQAGGAEVYTHRVARAWVADGHDVTLFCAAVPGRPSVEEIDGITVMRRGGRYSVYRAARQFFERQGRGRFDLVVDEVNTRPFEAHRWASGTPVVALAHQVAREVWFHELPWPAAALGRFLLEPRWLHRMQRTPVLTVSPSSARSLRAFGVVDVSVVPEGVDAVTPPAVAREQAPTVLFVGRLASNKRPDHAIEAFRLLRERIPNARLWVVGTGPMEAALRRSLPPGVEMLGRIGEEEKLARLAQAHCLVATSVREGWGLVVTEAAQCGTPSVGYDVDGLRDSLAASNGMAVAPRPQALADALAEHLPRWVSGDLPSIAAGGVLPWPAVARDLLQVAASRLADRHRIAEEGEDVAVAWRRAMVPMAAALDRRAWSVLGIAALIGVAPAAETGASATANALASAALACLAVATIGAFAETLRIASRRALSDPVNRRCAAASVGQRSRWIPTMVVAAAAAAAAQRWFGSHLVRAAQPATGAWTHQLALAWSGARTRGAYLAAMRLPMGALEHLVHWLGGSSALAERLWLTLLFAGVGAAMAAFLTILRLSIAGIIAGAMAYAFSPYVMAMAGTQEAYLAAMALVPMLLTWVVLASRRERFSWWLSLTLAPAALLFGVVAQSPPLAVVCALAAVVAALGTGWVGGRSALISTLHHGAAAMPLLLLVASYWLAPFLATLATTHAVAEAAHRQWQWSELRAGIANGFWLNTSPSWGNLQQFPYARAFDHFPLVLWRYALPVAAFTTLGINHFRDDKASAQLLRLTVAAMAGSLVVVLLSTGTRMPGAFLYGLIQALPFGWLASEPGRFLFLAGFGYALLFAILVDRSRILASSETAIDTAQRIRPNRNAASLAPVALSIAVLIPAFPIVSSNAPTPSQAGTIPTSVVNPPRARRATRPPSVQRAHAQEQILLTTNPCSIYLAKCGIARINRRSTSKP